jgi:hypothetical protein
MKLKYGPARRIGRRPRGVETDHESDLPAQ